MNRFLLVFIALNSGILLLSQCSPKVQKQTEKTADNRTGGAALREMPEKLLDTEVVSSAAPVLSPAPQMVEVEKLPGQNNDNLTKGKLVWSASCNKCHEAYNPNTRNMAEWRPILKDMMSKAQLSGEESQHLLAFFNHYAKK
jgi:cytochrome c5